MSENYRVDWVWQNASEQDKADVLALWKREAALPEPMMEARLKQLAGVARLNSTNELVGVSTIYEQFNQQLESWFWYMRIFVAEKYRKDSIARVMSKRIPAELEARWQQGDYVIGVIMEIENELLKQTLNTGETPTSGFVFFGKNERGNHCRVRYFREAKLFTPKPVSAPSYV